MIAIEADYRVKSRHGTDPFTCVTDGKSAIRWVRIHAAELGIDPDRIAAGGGSAGGHVAACTATIPGFEDPAEDANVSSKSNALALFNPVIDTGPEGYGHERLKERYVEISPVDHVRADLPPTIMFMGTADKTTPLNGHLRFLKQARAAGADCSLFTFDGRGHGFFNKGRENDGPYRTTVHLMDQFFIRIGWLEGKPAIEPDTPAEAR